MQPSPARHGTLFYTSTARSEWVAPPQRPETAYFEKMQQLRAESTAALSSRQPVTTLQHAQRLQQARMVRVQQQQQLHQQQQHGHEQSAGRPGSSSGAASTSSLHRPASGIMPLRSTFFSASSASNQRGRYGPGQQLQNHFTSTARESFAPKELPSLRPACDSNPACAHHPPRISYQLQTTAPWRLPLRDRKSPCF